MKNTAKEILWPLSFIFRQAMRLRNRFYDRQILAVNVSPIPVVSVGNLTMGGTGKTPIICELVAWALEHKLKPGVVTRGYKSRVRDVRRVPEEADPGIFGDEPVMIAQKFTNVPVYVGADRVAAVTRMKSETDVQIVFADDAFQHRRLSRGVDIVVIDCTEPLTNYRVLPVGRGREDFSGLRRASVVILNKVNLATPEQKSTVLSFVEKTLQGLETPVVESEYYVRSLLQLQGGAKAEPRGFEPVVLLSGVGNPQGVERLLHKNFDIKKHFIFRDHYRYSKDDVRKIVDEAKRLGVRRVLLTEKDAVKVKALMGKDGTGELWTHVFWMTELSVKLSIKVKRLHEKILALAN